MPMHRNCDGLLVQNDNEREGVTGTSNSAEGKREAPSVCQMTRRQMPDPCPKRLKRPSLLGVRIGLHHASTFWDALRQYLRTGFSRVRPTGHACSWHPES